MFVEFAIIRRRVGGGGSGMAGELIHDGGEVSSISCRSVPILKKNINCDKFIKKKALHKLEVETENVPEYGFKITFL